MKKFIKEFVLWAIIVAVLEFLFVFILEIKDLAQASVVKCLDPQFVDVFCTKKDVLKYVVETVYNFNRANFFLLTLIIALCIPVMVRLFKRLRREEQSV